MSRRRWTGRVGPGQFQLDWNGSGPALPGADAHPVAAPPGETQPDVASPNAVPPVDPQGPAGGRPASPALRVRWDFRTRFPEPMPVAIDIGLIDPEEAGAAEAVRAIHESHASQMLATLRDIDVEADERRNAPSLPGRGVPVPAGPRPEPGPSRHQRWYANLLGVYCDLFGPDAAAAFDRFLRGVHARVELTVNTTPDEPARVTTLAPATVPADVRPPTNATLEPSTVAAPALSRARAPTSLPVARPLPQAVAAGNFGRDERGPIDPSADEVRDITEAHSELLVDLIAGVVDAERRDAGPAEVARRIARLQDAVQQYADDFGGRAAERLLAYARRVEAADRAPPRSGPRRGR